MTQSLFIDCLALAGWLVLGLLAMAVIGLFMGKPDWSQLKRLHNNEKGAVQSLSFVLTLPLFLMIMLFVLQVSQILIARVVVEYSAFTAARSAIVWIPARVTGDESENRMSRRFFVRVEEKDDGVWSVYQMQPTGPKFERIAMAASTALTPICPSGGAGAPVGDMVMNASSSLEKAYYAMAPGSRSNPRIGDRLQNKLAYAVANTRVEIEVWHKEEEPALIDHILDPFIEEFAYNEIGWQDQLHVTVAHDFALLPGPGRLLARKNLIVSSQNPQPTAPVANTGSGWMSDIEQRDSRTFVYTISSTVRMNNEGQISSQPLHHQPLGSLRSSETSY